MAEPVTIPISFFELTIDYARPRFMSDRGPVVEAMFSALNAWNPSVNDIELRTDGPVAQQGITLKLPSKQITFFFGAAHCRFSRDSVDWQSAPETIGILDACTSTLIQVAGVQLGIKKSAIAMHLQPKTTRFLDILKPFMHPKLAGLENEALHTMAVIGKWENRKVTVDGSGVLANGVFVRMERDFQPTTTWGQMERQLRTDQEHLFDVLGVEEEGA